MKTINNINGIPLHYARTVSHPYGTKGEQRNFSVEENFLSMLEKAFEEVFENCPLGVPEVITTAGILVDKPGQHGHGRAFDFDAIFWNEESMVTLNFLHQKELYLGIESFLRKHFGIVLNYFYPNHKDHWHLDVSVPVDFNETATSETLYVQMVLKYIYGEEILVDGRWGPQTRGMVKTVFEKLGITMPITTKKNYLKFLDTTGKSRSSSVKIKIPRLGFWKTLRRCWKIYRYNIKTMLLRHSIRLWIIRRQQLGSTDLRDILVPTWMRL